MKKNILIFSISIFCIFTNFVYSQVSIEGTIYGADTKEPQPFANVSLVNPESCNVITGAASNMDGKFKIHANQGTYTLIVSILGYKKYEQTNFQVNSVNINLGTIVLNPVAVNISEVVITAERSHIQNKPGKQVLNVGQDIAGSGGNVSNVLKVIPSVEVNATGDVSIRGNKNVKILINGKEVAYGIDPKTMLKQLPASSVEQVEVVTNTSVKEDPESSGGVINITLKKNLEEGFHLGAGVEYGVSPSQISGGIYTNYNAGKQNYYFNYSFLDEDYIMSYDGNRTYRQTNSLFKQISQTGNGDYNIGGHLFTGGVDYDFNKKSSLNLEMIHNIFKEKWVFKQSDKYFLDNNQETITKTQNNNVDDISFTDISFKLDSRPDSSQKINMLGKYSFGEFGGKRGINNVSDNMKSNINNKGTYGIGEFKTDYTKDFSSKFSIESGLLINYLHFDFSLNSTGLYTENSKYSYLQRKLAGYLLLKQNFNENFSLGLGSRLENYTSEGEEKITNTKVTQDYLKLFPNLQIQYILSKDKIFQTLSLSYSKRIRRPNYEELNPITDYTDPLNIRQGNPNLKPEMINSLELSHYYLNGNTRVTTTLFGNLTNDIIQYKATLIDDYRLKSTYINFSEEKSLGLEANFGLQPSKWWEFTPSFMIANKWFGKKPDGTSPPNPEGWQWNAKTNNNLKITKKLTGQIQLQYYSKSINAYYIRNSYYQTNAGIQYKFLQGLGKLGLGMNDIFNTGGKESYLYKEEPYNSVFVWHLQNRNFKLSLSLFF